MKNMLTIRYDASALVREVMQNYPEFGAGNCLKCVSWKYEAMRFTFIDNETGKEYLVDEYRLIRGLKLLLREVADGKLPGLNITAQNFQDVCNWDAYDTDALVQTAIFGKTIYG